MLSVGIGIIDTNIQEKDFKKVLEFFETKILIDNPINKLNQLNGYLYQWKEDDSYQYGVVAQELQKILPHAVSVTKQGIYTVAYNQIIPLLIEAIKELNKKLEAK
jgi:hypothetical protein